MSKRLAALILTCLLFSSIAAFLQVGAAARTIIVPDNYPSISAAIANAAAGDVIYVRSGVYNESAFNITRPVTIIGEDIKSTTVNLDPPKVNYTSIIGQTYPIPSNAITINANSVRISGLTISSKGGIIGNGDGIEFSSDIITIGMTCSITGSQVTIARNTLNGDDWRTLGNNLTLAQNTINAHTNGIESNGSYCSIHDNAIDGSLVIWGSNNIITHNSYELMFIFYGDNNTVQGNSGEVSLGNSDRSCSNNIISGNVMKGPSVWGIWLGYTCRNNVFYDNYIVDEGYASNGGDYNSGVILCNEYSGIPTNNTFYHNAFVNNSVNVRFYQNTTTGGNFWDNGVQGNYWSNYNGTGDTPYIINSENRDNYPLTAPLNAPTISIAPPVYDPPVDEASLPHPSDPTVTSTPASSPTQSTIDNPVEQPNPTTSPDSLLAIPELEVAVIVVLSAVIFIAAVFALKLKRTKA